MNRDDRSPERNDNGGTDAPRPTDLDRALYALRERLAGALPPAREDELRAAFRRYRLAGPGTPPRVRSRRRGTPSWAAAAAVGGLAVVLGLAAGIAGRDGAVGDPGAAALGAPAGTGSADRLAVPASEAFHPLLSGPPYSASASYSIVRVRIPLSALAPGTPAGRTVEADLLVGEDGLASGIRFNPAATVYTSTVTQ